MDDWVLDILADPVTKLPAVREDFATKSGTLDARVFLPNTPGFDFWKTGQSVYEKWSDIQTDERQLRAERDGVADVYRHIKMTGRILDVGGHIGLVREFLPPSVEFVSVDPFIDIPSRIPAEYRNVYSCLSRPLNFIGACAEFLPFQAGSFDWVHMRSMLDHLQSPDLALLEARRVLKKDGKLVVGLYVDGGRLGRRTVRETIKEAVRPAVALFLPRYRDRHTFHPTFANLNRIIADNGFRVIDAYWQPAWNDRVCYLTAVKS